MSRYHNAGAFVEGSMPTQATLTSPTLDLPISRIHIPGQPPRRFKHSQLNWPLLPQEDWREPQVAYFKLIWAIHLFTHVGPDGEMNFHGDGKVISHRRTELIARWYYLRLPYMQQPRLATSFSAITIWYSVETDSPTSQLLKYEFETMKNQSELWKPRVASIVRGCCAWHAAGPSLTPLPLNRAVITGDQRNYSGIDLQHFGLVYAMHLYFRTPELGRIPFSTIDHTLLALWIHMDQDDLPKEALKTPARYIWESLQLDDCGLFLRIIPLPDVPSSTIVISQLYLEIKSEA